jgi:hypothetical protein
VSEGFPPNQGAGYHCTSITAFRDEEYSCFCYLVLLDSTTLVISPPVKPTLWVALVCQNLEKIPQWNTLAKLNTFPPGLDSLYERMMEQICNSDNADLCKRVLASIAIIYRPITLKELTSLVEMPELDDLESLREIIGLCGSFLAIREDMIYFVHQSVKDYLLGKAFDKIFPSGKEEIHYAIC